MQWETVIGLEIHTQLATKSKIFSAAPTAFGAKPNTQACVVDLGLPGVLPVLNEQVVALAVRFGKAIEALSCIFILRSADNNKTLVYLDTWKDVLGLQELAEVDAVVGGLVQSLLEHDNT